jgi:SprT protein
MGPENLREAIKKYVPEEVVDVCVEWITTHRISVRIKKTRQSKFGDYHAPRDGNSHRISINHELNRYAFLITFTHEVAHLLCYIRHGNRPMPHGSEWKHEFRNLLVPFIYKDVFPVDVKDALLRYLKDPAASSCTDIHLQKILSRYDQRKEGVVLLDELDEGALFRIWNGKTFIKGKKLRKNFECYEAKRRHKYFMYPLMEVTPVEEQIHAAAESRRINHTRT